MGLLATIGTGSIFGGCTGDQCGLAKHRARKLEKVQ